MPSSVLCVAFSFLPCLEHDLSISYVFWFLPLFVFHHSAHEWKHAKATCWKETIIIGHYYSCGQEQQQEETNYLPYPPLEGKELKLTLSCIHILFLIPFLISLVMFLSLGITVIIQIVIGILQGSRKIFMLLLNFYCRIPLKTPI